MEEGSGWCPRCGRWVLMRRETVNHVFHAIMTFLFCGFWAIVWLSASGQKKPWRCACCGLPLEAEEVKGKKSLDTGDRVILCIVTTIGLLTLFFLGLYLYMFVW